MKEHEPIGLGRRWQWFLAGSHALTAGVSLWRGIVAHDWQWTVCAAMAGLSLWLWLPEPRS